MPKRNRSKKKVDEISGEKSDEKSKKEDENLAKKSSKNKRDEFKEDVVKKKKKRRRRPRKKKEKAEGVSEEELKKAPKVSFRDDYGLPLEEEEEEVQPEATVEPINPFEEELPEQEESKLPTPEYEERLKEEEEFLEPEEPLEEISEEEQAPINPFEAEESPVPTIEKKALEGKPLDRKDQELKAEKFEPERKKTPEVVEQAAEKVSVSEEQMSEEGAAQEAEAADNAEKAKEPPVIAEVVEAKPEVEVEAEQPLEGVVQPAEAEKAPEVSHEVEEFKEELWDILAQAGITKKKIITILLIIVFVVLFVWFGGLKLFGLGGGDGVQKTVEEGDDVVDEILPSTTGEGDVSGIVSSYVFGLEFETPKTPIQAVPIGKSGTLAGVDAALYFGEGESAFENRFVYYVDLLRRMDSIYHTDVYSLIDLAVDRRAALTEHINELNAIIQEADNVYSEIKSRLESFDAEFEVLAVERDDLEEQFFVAVEGLMPRSSNDYLESFIEVQHDANELKAYYNAYRIALDLCIAYLDILEPRYQDIVANTEALIKGIRVFDVPSSDIEAILPIEGELE